MKIYDNFDVFCVLLDVYRKKGSLSAIEKDLALEKLRNMYSIIGKIRPVEDSYDLSEKEEKSITEPTKKPTDNTIEMDATVKEEVSNEEELKMNEDILPSEKTRESKVVEQVEIIEKKEKEKEEPVSSFINEQHSSGHQVHDISNKLSTKPIEDIGKAIGLNDRFLYINELFRGDSSLFKSTIEALNSMNNIEEGLKYIDQFNWNEEDENVQEFISLIKRKLA